MKRFMLLSAILGVMLSCAAAGASDLWEVMGPATFTRGTGAPASKVTLFQAAGGQATLKLSNDKVSSATVAINGEVVFGPSDFKRNAATLGTTIQLIRGENTLEVTLQSQPGSRITVNIVQKLSGISPEIMLARTAHALRVGDIGLALKGFLQDEKTLKIIPFIDIAKRNQLIEMLEKAVVVLETARSRYYRYSWENELGQRTVEFSISIDDEGKWIIVSW